MEFEWVKNFKYLYTELNVSDNNNNNINNLKEILNRKNSANKCFFGLKTVLKSKLVPIKSQLTLCNDAPDSAICVWNLDYNKSRRRKPSEIWEKGFTTNC